MHEEYDFSNAKRAKNIPHLVKLQSQEKPQSKTRITIMLDNEESNNFRTITKDNDLG